MRLLCCYDIRPELRNGYVHREWSLCVYWMHYGYWWRGAVLTPAVVPQEEDTI